MQLVERSEALVHQVTYVLQQNQWTFVYKEWLDASGGIIDFVLRDKDGHDVHNENVLEEIQEFVDRHESSLSAVK